MSSADRALATIDEGLELAAAPAYLESGYGPPGSDEPEWCWRCDAARASTDVGLCESCRVQMQDEKTTATDPDDAWSTITVLNLLSPEGRSRLDAMTARSRLSMLLDGLPNAFELRCELRLPIPLLAIGGLVLPPGPERDVEIEFDVAHAETCEGCRSRARDELSIEPEPGPQVLFDAHGRLMGAPVLVRGLVTPEDPDPPWVMLVFSSGRSHVIDLPLGNHWSSWLPHFRWVGPGPDEDDTVEVSWQSRAREFYDGFTEPFSWISAMGSSDV